MTTRFRSFMAAGKLKAKSWCSNRQSDTDLMAMNFTPFRRHTCATAQPSISHSSGWKVSAIQWERGVSVANQSPVATQPVR